MDVASPPQSCTGNVSSGSLAAAAFATHALATKFAADGPRPAAPAGARHPSAQGQGHT